MKPDALQSVLSKLKGCKQTSPGQFMARCPAHHDETPSLSVSKKGDKVLIHCHAGCSTEAVLDSVGMDFQDLFDGASPAARRRNTTDAGHPTSSYKEEPEEPEEPEEVHPAAEGLTLARFAEAKGLPTEFLAERLYLEDTTYLGRPAVLIPYFSGDGSRVTATRYRIALSGDDRFRWASKSEITLYGLQFLPEFPESERVYLVEGESDAMTLIYQGIPALGLPGASTWKEEVFGPIFANVKEVIVVIEPDRGGEAMLEWLARSSIRSRARLIFMDEFKDPSELYLADRAGFRARMLAAADASSPFVDLPSANRMRRRAAAWRDCRPLATKPDILSEVLTALHVRGLVGEDDNARLLYLCLTTRFFPRPISVIPKGPSGSGKSFLTETVLGTFPASAVIKMTSGSEKSLVYCDEEFANRFIYIAEAAGVRSEFQDYCLRTLTSEGRLEYRTVEKNKDGQLQDRIISKRGPTGVLMTTTRASINQENETRMLSLSTLDTPEQTKAILLATAQQEDMPSGFTAELQAFQEWITCGEHKVWVPFAMTLAELTDPSSIRIRRDFQKVLDLVRAHALLHQATRKIDARHGVVAEIRDYRAVHEVLGEVIDEAVEAAVPPRMREIVEAVQAISRANGGRPVSYAQLIEATKLDRSTISRQVGAATERGLLQNLQPRPGMPCEIVPGKARLLEKESVLPTPEALEAAFQSQART